MIDILAAMVVLAVLSSMVITSLELSRRLERKTLKRNQALFVIDNSLERFAAANDKSFDHLRALFKDECEKSGMGAAADLTPSCRLDENVAVLRVDSGDKTLVKVEIPYTEKENQ